MAKKSKPVIYAEYLAFRIAFMVFRAMPLDAALTLARWVSPILWLLHVRHRKVAMDNLRRAFGGQRSERELRRIVRGVYEHLVMVGVETLRMPEVLRPDTWRQYVHVENMRVVEDVIASGKGAIFITGHMGNWELNSFIMTLLGHPLHTVARLQDNPLLEDYISRRRSAMGRIVADKKGALRALMRTLREDKFLGLIVDQDARDQGIFVEFFGRQSSWIPSPAILARKFNVPIIPAFNYREGKRFRYTIVVHDPILPVRTGDDAEDVRRMVAQYARQLEQFIRRHPEQWLWNHRRWKTRPPQEAVEQRQNQPEVAVP